ncbi:MAG: histidine--tRNA ligase [Bacteroidales bacterium]|jgi:histidyl-tRNA synthetase
MSLQKPSIPKGTRDFSPLEMVRRNFIFDTIRKVFQLFGYQPIETPAMENLSTLLGKYGEEGDKLLFKILNSGDFLEPVKASDLIDKNYKELTTRITEKGLRYDLTVPFARFVVQHQNEIVFPFKRYQIQPVWRADRPQKGRYREFFQCDVDVIGSDSLLYEVELVQIVDKVFRSLGVNYLVKLNNRKILSGIAEIIGVLGQFIDLTVSLDKMEKTGIDPVLAELRDKGFSDPSITALMPFLEFTAEKDSRTIISFLKEKLQSSEIGMKGINELDQILNYLADMNLADRVEPDISLARGLNYYTGTIIEIKASDVPMGSICGGGRYDDLTGIFGLEGISGVGISFGADRIYDLMNELNLFPDMMEATTKVLFVNFGAAEEKYCLPLLSELREIGIPAEIFPESAKMKKQLDYANRKNIAYVILVGENELKENKLTLKNMRTGEQSILTWEEVMKQIAR